MVDKFLSSINLYYFILTGDFPAVKQSIIAMRITNSLTDTY